MIPLMYAAKSGSLMVEDTIAITDMDVEYSHLGHEIIVKYKFNLNQFFSLKIKLNEFDQVKAVYLYDKRAYEEVRPEKDIYVIKTREAVMKIKYEEIMKIVNVAITSPEIKNIAFRAYLFNSEDRSLKIDSFSITSGDNPLIRFTSGDNELLLETDNNEIVLSVNYEALKPSYIMYDYFVFEKVKIEDVEYDIAVQHPKAWAKFFVLRDNKTRYLLLEDNILIDAANNHYKFIDGVVVINDENVSSQAFLEDTYQFPYKQFFYNIIRDNNIYTEMTSTLAALKTNSFYVIDIKDDLILTGKIDIRIKKDEQLRPYVEVSLSKIRDQYNRVFNKNISVRINPKRLQALIGVKDNSFIKEDMLFFVDEKIQYITDIVINKEGQTALSASNNQYVFVLGRSLLFELYSKAFGASTISILDESAAINNGFIFKAIDYNKEVIEINNLTETIEVPFKQIEQSDYIISEKEARLFHRDGIDELFGIKFRVVPLRIEVTSIPFWDLDTFVLLIKETEPSRYLISDIKEDIFKGAFALVLYYLDKEIWVVYNYAKKYFYFINRTNQDVSKDIMGLKGAELYFKGYDKEKLEYFILFKSSKRLTVSTFNMAVALDKNINMYPFMVYKGLNSSYYKTDHIPYFNSFNPIMGESNYEKGLALKEKFRGIYLDAESEIKSISLNDSSIEVLINVDGEDKKFYIVSSDEANKSFFNKKFELQYEKCKGAVIKDLENISVKGSISIYEIMPGHYIGIDAELLRLFIDRNNLALNNEVFFVKDELDCFLLTESATEIDIENFNVEQESNKAGMVERAFGKDIVNMLNPSDIDLKVPSTVDISQIDDKIIIYDSIFSAYIKI